MLAVTNFMHNTVVKQPKHLIEILFLYLKTSNAPNRNTLTRSLRKTRILVFGNCYLPAENENFLFAVAFFNGASFSILFYLKSTLTAYQTEFKSFPYCFVFKAAK